MTLVSCVDQIVLLVEMNCFSYGCEELFRLFNLGLIEAKIINFGFKRFESWVLSVVLLLSFLL